MNGTESSPSYARNFVKKPTPQARRALSNCADHEYIRAQKRSREKVSWKKSQIQALPGWAAVKNLVSRIKYELNHF